jgi:hypothetical protein
MRKTPPDIERDIRRRLLEGKSYEEAADGRTSKSTVNRIVEDIRKDVPDFDEVRELNIRLKSEGRTALEVMRSMDEKDEFQPMVITVYPDSPEKNEAVEHLKWALARRVTLIACKNCHSQFQIPLHTAEFYRELVYRGQGLPFVCPYCGFLAQYAPFEILGLFALTLLEKDTIIIRLDLSPYW